MKEYPNPIQIFRGLVEERDQLYRHGTLRESHQATRFYMIITTEFTSNSNYVILVYQSYYLKIYYKH